MISPSERAYITEYAYVPEHLPHYVTAISRTEPFLVGDFVAHVIGTHLIFIGYPLSKNLEEAQLLKALESVKSQFEPETISLVAPALLAKLNRFTSSSSDVYYRLEVPQLIIPQKTRNMLARARQEISVSISKFGREHKKLIDDFLRTHRLEDEAKFIFRSMKEYVAIDTALIFDARNARGDLVAFDVAEFGARKYAFYMFNFRSRKYNIPGASDLLLEHVIEHAKTEGKRYINMGLGINSGIIFFKKKWGATPFLNYVAGVQESNKNESWGELINQFTGL